MNNAMDFLLWVRGPAFDIAVTVFVIGVLVRLLEILLLGRRPYLSEARGSQLMPGLKTVSTRFLAETGTLKRALFVVIGGYVFHLGFFITLLLFVPHIELLKATFGIQWPGLPTPVVDAVTVVTLVALIALLGYRLAHPVMRFLSGFEDYLVWLLTFLPLLTGYLAFHRLIDPYPLALGLHILSVEILLILFPFTKLMHTFTAFLARWYNGAMAGRRGVES